ncbi:YHS domain-containing (seleno)protein [Ekhidna sp.]|uniref:YHS domain-containing (seleno)protein n=1 Tax=Ekhidna sp. TaxID=2608089 RepID=UPI003296D6ED
MRKIGVLLSVVGFIVACSDGSEITKNEIYSIDGIALDGYDPVAYFIQGEAKKGIDAESVEHQELVYYFSSTKNRLLFKENPSKFLPEYGGWCAYAVAETSSKMEPDPTQWQIQNGELILFTSNWMTKLTGSLKDEWNASPEDFQLRADSNWVEMN